MRVVADQLIKQATAATLRFQPTDSDGEAAVEAGTVTVGVTRSDGTAVLAAGTATVVGSGATPNRSVALTATHTANLDLFTATWSIGATVLGTSTAEIVGGFLVSVVDFQARESSMTDKLPALILAARREVEDAITDACNRAFTPRFTVERISGNGQGALHLEMYDVREVRWARTWATDQTTTAFTVGELAALRFDGSGVYRTDGVAWPWGTHNIEVGYSYGLDRPPHDLVAAVRRAIRQAITRPSSAIPDQSISFQTIDGVNAQLATPGIGIWVTGIPYVDEVLKRHTSPRLLIG